jgi:hypothetical protein
MNDTPPPDDAKHNGRSHSDELRTLAEQDAAERKKFAETKRRADERDETYFRPYDAVWLDLVHAPCNPVADEPLDPEWLLERVSTLVERARAMDEFDGQTACIEHLRSLPDSEAASMNRIAKAVALAIAAATNGELSEDLCGSVCSLMTRHPGNEVDALYRTRPEAVTSPAIHAHMERLQREWDEHLKTPEGKRRLEDAKLFGYTLQGRLQGVKDFWRMRYGSDETPPLDWESMYRWKARLGISDEEFGGMTAAILTERAEEHLDTLHAADQLRRLVSGGDTIADLDRRLYEVDVELARIRIDGKAHDVPVEAARMAKLLLDADGEWVAMAKNGFTKPSTTRLKLPKELQKIIESDKGKGYRLRCPV